MTSSSNDSTEEVCAICQSQDSGEEVAKWIQCSVQKEWYHQKCLKMSNRAYNSASRSNFYSCPSCTRQNSVARQFQRVAPRFETVALTVTRSAAVHTPEGETQQETDHNEPNTDLESQTVEDSSLIRDTPPVTPAVLSHQRESIPESDVNEPIVNESNDTTSEPNRDDVSGPSTSTDIDPNEVIAVLDHRGTGPNRRFKLKFADGSTFIVKEKECYNCADIVADYCKRKRITQTFLSYHSGVGHSNGELVIENWREIGEILDIVKKYGNNSIIAEEFIKLKEEDGLYACKIGTHCFAALYLKDMNLAIVADGLNSYSTNLQAQEFFKLEFPNVRIHVAKFIGQNQNNRCAAAAAGALIDLQRAYLAKEVPDTLWCPESRFKRINQTFHPHESKNIIGWQPVDIVQKKKLSCPSCGQPIKGQNRGALKLHRCKN